MLVEVDYLRLFLITTQPDFVLTDFLCQSECEVALCSESLYLFHILRG